MRKEAYWRAVVQLGLALTFTGVNLFVIGFTLPHFRGLWTMEEWLLSLLATAGHRWSPPGHRWPG